MATAAVIALVLGGIAATLSYLAAERERREAAELAERQAAEADQAAQEFFDALAAHEQVWTEEAVDATYGPDVAEALFWINLDAADLDEAAEDLEHTCAEQADAVAAFEELEGSSRPELESVPGNSPSYRSAQSAAQSSHRLAEAEQVYLEEGRALAEQILTHCQGWSQSASAVAEAHMVYEEGMEATLVPQGQRQTEGNWTMTCEDSSGCLPLVRAEREQYAQLTMDFQTVLHEQKTEVFTRHCLEPYQVYCEKELELARAQLDGARTATDLLYGPLGSGSTALPGYNNALQDWNSRVEDLREEAGELLIEVDPDVSGGPADYYGTHQRAMVSTTQDRIAELAQATLDRPSVDYA